MKKAVASFLIFFMALLPLAVDAQCSICTRTAAQMGEKPAKDLNLGILYLALTPFAIVGFIGYRFWKGGKKLSEAEV